MGWLGVIMSRHKIEEEKARASTLAYSKKSNRPAQKWKSEIDLLRKMVEFSTS
jgi:hypothetical protein